jgi:FkbM family methyltransferase
VVPEGGIAIDVGANIGAHTIPLAKRCDTVVAFEPQRLVFQTLCANVALNGLTNVQTFHAGVGAEPGSVVIPDLDPNQEQNFGGLHISGHESGNPVPIVPLDSFAVPKVHLIKIDVEGMELEVLKGAKGMIKHYKPVLYVENDRAENSEALCEFISDLGYEYEEHRTPLFNPENFAEHKENVFGQIVSINLACWPR